MGVAAWDGVADATSDGEEIGAPPSRCGAAGVGDASDGGRGGDDCSGTGAAGVVELTGLGMGG